ncbi:MAG: RsmB/NOP family class I SAM-dependent RNA methyltransferase [Alphaproteobacteria bacterium]
MTPGGRIAAAIELLELIARGKRPADRAISGYFRSRRYAGARDRAAVQNQIYRVIRQLGRLRWHLAAIGATGHVARTWVIAELVLGEGWSRREFAEVFSGREHDPAPLTGDEARWVDALGAQADADASMPVSAWLNYPGWLGASLVEAFGEAFVAEMRALNRPAPVDLRVNTLKASREAALEALTAEGLEAVPTPLSPWGLRLAERVVLGNHRAFRDGLIEPQDEGSQLLALIVGARPGETVVDLCAGAGGKTLALAAAMEDRGRVIACDSAPYRLRRMKPRLRRAGVGCVELKPLQTEDDWPKVIEAQTDRVLIDAPCSGTGSWRRRPYARWRLSPDDLVRYPLVQARLLRDGARLVKPGGRLIYATCSVLREENDEQLEGFLARHRDFKPVGVRRAWREAVGGACPASGFALNLSPARNGTDGVYAAVMERAA